MCSAIITGIFTISGVILGFVSNLIISGKNNKREDKRALLAYKVQVYSEAINYISMCCTEHRLDKILEKEENPSVRDLQREVNSKSEEKFKSFFPKLSLLEQRDKLEEYNNLVNRALHTDISYEEAYNEVHKILDYNISKEFK